jgi:hypothetical protein
MSIATDIVLKHEMNTPRDLADRGASKKKRLVRERFRLAPTEARKRARREFQAFPSETYLTEIESWRDLPDGFVEFTVKRLSDS